ncbi:MAG: hypothetical protein H6712_19510 [Myxococcales bacterium]|nr:hypothetical protein [Myxococcales bacterium]MCB9716064.1 hypothetical protein [Myxococcales bacterium]
MITRDSLRTLLLAASFGGLGGLGLGCVITVGPLDCSECGNTGCNSQLVNGECKCDLNHQWANPDDPNDFECDRIPGKGGDPNCGGDPNNPVHLEGDVCVCDPGYTWCNPGDLSDLSCCVDDDQTSITGGEETGSMTTGMTDDGMDETADGSTGGGLECMETEIPWNGVEPDAADCTEVGLVFCSNNDTEGPGGSRYWECDGAMWVELPNAGNESCQFDEFDFSYGCVDDGTSVTFVCGDGPGTPCSGPECNGCADDGDQIQFCEDGKLAGDSCNTICTEVGDDMGITYDYGSCVLTEDGSAECACCDSGDEGCPV